MGLDEREERLHLLEDDYVRAPMAVARLAPLELLGHVAAQQDWSQDSHLFAPPVRALYVCIDLGVHVT